MPMSCCVVTLAVGSFVLSRYHHPSCTRACDRSCCYLSYKDRVHTSTYTRGCAGAPLLTTKKHLKYEDSGYCCTTVWL
eukprot:scaffold202101_cov37-Tisochrysis_lutea.AAC.1